MNVLIGSTGLVGTSLQRQIKFDMLFNSKNINIFNNTVEDGCDLYLSCLPAAKWLVNQNIWKDLQNLNSILEIISHKTYRNVYLFSTIDVYCESPLESNEDHIPQFSKLSYGANRYFFELLISATIKRTKLNIIRLPALYNRDLKKNIIFDLLNNNNIDMINSNSSYQWLNLDRIMDIANNLISKNPDKTIFNLFPAPIETSYIIDYFPQYKIKSNGNRIEYNYKTKYSSSGYVVDLKQSKFELGEFLNASLSK